MTGALPERLRAWVAARRHARAARALERQLANQQAKARAIAGREASAAAYMLHRAQTARAKLERVRPIPEHARVLEVGSGAHGLIFAFGSEHGIGVDPLAHPYASLFPAWQRRVPTVGALGEALPFGDAVFDVVLTDNVVDHAEGPAVIMAEIARVLAPGGLLYFTVHVHHPLYAFAAALHAGWRALGVPLEIKPFADHTTHFTPGTARGLFTTLPFRIVDARAQIAEAKEAARRMRPRHAGDRLKRLFYKNAVFEVVAVRGAER